MNKKNIEVQELTPLEDWLNSDVATDMLGISLRSLQNLRSSGMLPYAKLCGKCYYKRSDLEALLESKYGCSISNGNGYGKL